MSKSARLPWLLSVLSVLSVLLCLGLAGCGADQGLNPGSAGGSGAATGRAVFRVVWPQISRLIPAASNSIKFVVTRDGQPTSTPIAGVVIARPNTTATLDNLPVGDLFVTVTAYPQAGAQGVPQATATVQLVIVRNQTTNLSVTLNSTVNVLQIISGTPPVVSSTYSITGNQTLTLTATPRDLSGNVVLLLPGNLQWLSDNPAIASVTPTGNTVTVAGHSPGTTGITVNYVEPPTTGGVVIKSTRVTVTVNSATFTATGNMTTTRSEQTATLLTNGNVLVAGGAYADLYNPATGAFSATPAMTKSRIRHTATLLQNGSVLLAGGEDGSGAVLSSAEVYSATTGTFTATGPMSTAREYATATLLTSGPLAGKVLVAGGQNASGALATAEIYDPVAGTFAATGSMTAARSKATATLLADGTVLIAGGDDGSGNALASAEIFDPAANGGAGAFHATTGSMNSPRELHTATRLTSGPQSGKVLIAAGWNGTAALASAETYDPTTGTFTALTSTMSSPRYRHTATLMADGARVFIAGGSNGSQVLNTAEIYNSNTGQFTSLPDTMLSPRENHTATLLANGPSATNGSILIAGGDNGQARLSSAALTNPAL